MGSQKRQLLNSSTLRCWQQSSPSLFVGIDLTSGSFNVAYLLNKGHEIDSINIKEILDEHNEFANNFHEAIFYKKKREVYAKQSDWFKFDLMDSKYHRAKELAYLHKNKLRKSFHNG